jgi:hypothetical protein
MTNAEYEQLKDRIESEYRANLQALNLVWKMSQDNAAPLSSKVKYRKKIVEDTILTMPTTTFTFNDVYRSVAEKISCSNSGIRAILLRLEKKGRLKVIHGEHRNIPNIYSLSEPSSIGSSNETAK